MLEIAIFIVILGLLFDYTNGMHDSANVVSTVIATKALRPMVAIVLAGILNAIGATRISGVAETITKGLIIPGDASFNLIISAILGAIVWNVITVWLGIPSSSSYALIGALVGATIKITGTDSVIWTGLWYKVVLPMIFSPIIGFAVAYLFMKIFSRFLTTRDKFCRFLQIGSASLVALSHGFNDAQKSMAIITLGLFTTGFLTNLTIPLWVILACALMMGLGTATGGFRIIQTVGFKLTPLKLVQGFSAELSASFTIITAALLGMPISSTQVIVGGVTGVGSAENLSAVSWKTVYKLVIAWILTIPGAGLVAAFISYLLRLIASQIT